MKKYLPSSALVIALVLANSYSARAQEEITLLAPGSIRQALGELVPSFEQKTGKKVKVTFGSGGGTKEQIARGELFDVSVLQPPYPEVLASGNVVASSAAPLATVAVGMAVRKGALKPDISTPEAVKQTLLAAQSITYSDPAGTASGVAISNGIEKLGIAEQMQPKTKLNRGGDPLESVAQGESEIGLVFLVDMDNPGIDVVGPLPREFVTPTGFVGFVSSRAKDPAAANELLDYLSSPDAAPVYRAKGMQPGS